MNVKTKRTKTKREYIPYSANDNIAVVYELGFKDDTIKPGDRIWIKNKGWYKFRLLAHNIKLDTSWVDCVDCETGEWKAFRVDQITKVDRPKKSYRKKIGK